MRNLKKLGLALMAVLALSGIMASAALAEDGAFTAAEYPATVTATVDGEQHAENYFEVGTLQVYCHEQSFHGTLPEPSSTLAITPDYDDCESSLGTDVTVDLNGCTYLFHATTPVDEAENVWELDVDVICPEGKEIKVTAGLCNVDVKAQNGLSGITATNTTEASPKDVDLDVEVGLAAKGTNVFLCPSSVVNATTAKYVSSLTVEAFEDLEGVPEEGDQIDASISTLE